MKLAIHDCPGSFSVRWIAYCEKKEIPFKKVNCFDSDIIAQLTDCDALLWHHHQTMFKDTITAKRILFALEHAGVKVFPDFNTGWHFDDKVAQKYLLEAIDAPLVPSYVFYDKQKALKWVQETSFPKVFKLKGGAGSANVKLIKSKVEAKKLVQKAFGTGISQYDRWGSLKERYRNFKLGEAGFIEVVKGLVRLVIPTEFARLAGREKGYVYFQKFLPNNDFDIRVIVIGNRAFAVKRIVRQNDFRASGSGVKRYGKEEIDIECVKIAFEVNKKIKSQSIAYDFVYDENNTPLLLEICYGFAIEFYDPCPGYWDRDLNWHEGKFVPQEWMVDDLVESLQ